MIKQIILLLILLLLKIEALENICTNKEEAEYGQEELEAYYIRKEKIKLLKKKCERGEQESCRVLALENIYSIHPCITENDKMIKEGHSLLLDLCDKNNAKSCYSYALHNKKKFNKYQKLACKLDNSFCIKKEKVNPLINAVSRYKQIQNELVKLDNICIKKKDGSACSELAYYYDYQDMFQPYFLLVEQNKTKAHYYQYYSCLYDFDDSSCRIEGDGDYGKPILWMKERASKLDLSLLVPYWNYDELNRESTQSRDMVRYIDQEQAQIWQIGVDKKLYQAHTVREMYRGKCTDYIPKDGNWKLATRKEILSVIDLFEKEKKDFQYYWTSEQSKEDLMDYWVVNVKNGTTHEVYKNNHYDKGCVYLKDFKK